MSDQGPDPLRFLVHSMAWAGWEADGKTGRVRCLCGWEGTPSEFHDHCGILAWTDDEIRKAFF